MPKPSQLQTRHPASPGGIGSRRHARPSVAGRLAATHLQRSESSRGSLPRARAFVTRCGVSRQRSRPLGRVASIFGSVAGSFHSVAGGRSSVASERRSVARASRRVGSACGSVAGEPGTVSKLFRSVAGERRGVVGGCRSVARGFESVPQALRTVAGVLRSVTGKLRSAAGDLGCVAARRRKTSAFQGRCWSSFIFSRKLSGRMSVQTSLM